MRWVITMHMVTGWTIRGIQNFLEAKYLLSSVDAGRNGQTS